MPEDTKEPVETYVPIALEIFDLHYNLDHPRPFLTCPDRWCQNAQRTVIREALDALRSTRSLPEGVRGPYFVKLRAGGADWLVTEPGAPCDTTSLGKPSGMAEPHCIGEHLPGGQYAGVPLNHELQPVEWKYYEERNRLNLSQDDPCPGNPVHQVSAHAPGGFHYGVPFDHKKGE